MLELAIAEAVEHAERMLKTFESGCAVAQDLLQLMIDKLEVVRQHASGAPVQASNPAFPGEPVVMRAPEGVFVEGAGVVSIENLAAAGVPIATDGATSRSPAATDPATAVTTNEQPTT